jgi:hypothetical protein
MSPQPEGETAAESIAARDEPKNADADAAVPLASGLRGSGLAALEVQALAGAINDVLREQASRAGVDLT